MTVEAQRPTGTPGTAPRGPAGPRPEPTGPKNPTPKPGTQKPPPASPKGRLADELDSADLLLMTLGVLVLAGMDPALRMQFNQGLKTMARAVHAAQSPARRDLSGSGADPTTVATTGGPVPNSGRDGKVTAPGRSAVSSRPVQLLAGRPPLPGGAFLLPESRGLPSFEALLNP